MTEFVLPPKKERVSSLEVLMFYMGRWVHVRWSTKAQCWITGKGGEMLSDGGRAFAPLPPKPEGAVDFYTFDVRK